MDGFEVAKRLKEDPLKKDIPFLFLTAHTDDDTIKKAFYSGAKDYIKKPILDIAKLLTRLKKHLD